MLNELESCVNLMQYYQGAKNTDVEIINTVNALSKNVTTFLNIEL